VHLIDTSAWIEYLRATGSSADAEVARLIEANAPIATTEPVIMEHLGRAGEPSEVGRVVAFIGSPANSYMTGADVNVDGGSDF
jgi:NAD(P)-dependent dehydrogenase (short-subunit alcohol dehydrogenase family)